MIRREFLGAVASAAGGLKYRIGCDCSLAPAAALPPGSDVFKDVGSKLRITNMKVFGINGIPHAFVVDRGGKIIWHGSPSSPEMDNVISGALKKRN